jgi:phosphoribosylamine--glycine ligase
MRVLVIGSGGREHALAWRLRRSESVTQVIAAPGNPGIAQEAECVSVPDAAPETFLKLAEERDIDLTVVGPEAPLVAGIVDAFEAAGKKIVGPTARNARLEGSKVFAKQFFAQHKIPTAAFDAVTSAAEAEVVLRRSRYPVVVKADGLAAGKGVVIARDRAEAEQAVQQLGPNLVIEEFLEGEEISFIVLSDGKDGIALEPCQDHKAALVGDRGPNTGGMGAYSDPRILSAAQHDEIMATIIQPTIEATAFTGFLYAGLMMTAGGPKLLEFNVRLGDPETQPLMQRMVADFGQVLWAATNRELYNKRISWSPNPSVCVIVASAGYPGNSTPGMPIEGVSDVDRLDTNVFHSGTRLGLSGRLETAGGRVLGVTASGNDLKSAISRAYESVGRIHFAGMHFRRDIGQKGLRHYNGSTFENRTQSGT